MINHPALQRALGVMPSAAAQLVGAGGCGAIGVSWRGQFGVPFGFRPLYHALEDIQHEPAYPLGAVLAPNPEHLLPGIFAPEH